MLLGVLKSQIFPVNPVQPAVGQFDAILTLQTLLRRHLHGQNIGPARYDEFRNIQFELVIHADNRRPVRHLVAVQPNVGPVIDSLEDERVNIAA